MQDTHKMYMQRCLQLAAIGEGSTAPNPMVGAILVHQGKIIGEGYHACHGQAHAEVNALAAVAPEDRHLIADATLYVSLEPCNHYGKTPPCTSLILENNIKKVVVGITDPNPLVAGSGINRLKENGVEVIYGIEEEKCKIINRKFFKAIQQKMPWITLKWAQSLDGFIAGMDGQTKKISNDVLQRFTHRLRLQHMAIMVGYKTIQNDNPLLNNRLWSNNSPIPIIIDIHQKLKGNELIFKSPKKPIHLTEAYLREAGINNYQLKTILQHLYSMGIQSILVEGGAYTNEQFLQQQCWDECIVYTGNMHIQDGIHAPKICGKRISVENIQNDLIEIFEPHQ